MSCDYFQFTDQSDSFETWQGLRGPKGDPGEPGPKGDPGTGLTISGTVASVDDLPETAAQGTVYNVGASEPYELYMYETGTGWISLGYLEGPQGPEGPEGPPGKGLTISGTVASTSQLPATAEQGTVYNVGASEPYELYMYETGTGWISLGYLEGPPGQDGDDGTTFTPSVSAEGVISWTNDGGKQNPPSVNIKGPQGATGPAGQDGSDGAPGADGVSPEVTITSITGGHTVTITDADHPTGQNFNVMDGTDGQDGSDGAAAGFGTPTVSVGSGTGTPSASVSASGPDTAKIFAFSFNNLKGEPGDAAVKLISISLGTTWSGAGPYTQTVTVSGGTATSKVDLQPDAATIAQLISDGVLALYIVNNAGTFTAVAVGAATTTALTIQATRVEVTT